MGACENVERQRDKKRSQRIKEQTRGIVCDWGEKQTHFLSYEGPASVFAQMVLLILKRGVLDQKAMSFCNGA